MDGISPWVAAVKNIFSKQNLPVIYQQDNAGYRFKIHQVNNALWIAVTCPGGTRLILRTAYAPNDDLKVTKVAAEADRITIHVKAALGGFKVTLQFLESDKPLIRYTTTLKPAGPLLIPFWPKDLVIIGPEGKDSPPTGEIHVTQAGTRSGLQFITLDKPKSGSLLYMQNLTAMNDYCQATETSLADTVGGNWPELGFALPPAREKPIPTGKEITIGDGLIAFSPQNPKGEFGLAKQFIDLLAAVYVHLPRPDTQYHDWPTIMDKGLYDLGNSHGCWSHADGFDYLNAYVSDYKTPPELMVQLAVLLPMQDFKEWSNQDLPVINKINDGIGKFYDDKIGSMVRWLPAIAKELDGSEEQLKPNIMDSWYLHHPLLNLSRMALKGDKNAEMLFLNSLDFVTKVAKHFKYNWPVFYNMETLEVIKAETKPGMGGQKDVAGLYAHVMLQAWELTKDKKYFTEAEKAAKSLQGKGFDIFYQANNTAFSANSMLRLYKETKNELYLNLCYLCLAGIMKNLHIWECDYGYAKNYATFFGVFPLNDAPYTAAYEEQEVFASMHDLLLHAEDVDILPSLRLLLPEFIRYIVQRAGYYYPGNLPMEMLSDEVKMGEVDPKLWIAIEDIHDGWEKSGAVGQEVYGAGVAFGIIPRHYYKVPNELFMIYADYPTNHFSYSKKDRSVTFKVKGDGRFACRMLIVKNKDHGLPKFKVTAGRAGDDVLKPITRKDGHLEYEVYGDQQIRVSWSNGN